MPGRLIHTAQALVDEVAEVPVLPARGQNVMATSVTRYAASAVNVLVTAARSGASGLLADAVGTGPNADLIRQVLADEGVTEFGTTREPVLEFVAGLGAGVDVVLDPGAILAGFPAALHDRVLALTTVWTSNAEEAARLTGRTGTEAVRALADRLPDHAVVVVRDGASGCVVRVSSSDTETIAVPGFPQTPVDTNGAGDCHTGILLAGRLAGLGWPTAARRANAGAAIKATRRGPNSASDRAEIDAFLSRVS